MMEASWDQTPGEGDVDFGGGMSSLVVDMSSGGGYVGIGGGYVVFGG